MQDIPPQSQPALLVVEQYPQQPELQCVPLVSYEVYFLFDAAAAFSVGNKKVLGSINLSVLEIAKVRFQKNKRHCKR